VGAGDPQTRFRRLPAQHSRPKTVSAPETVEFPSNISSGQLEAFMTWPKNIDCISEQDAVPPWSMSMRDNGMKSAGSSHSDTGPAAHVLDGGLPPQQN
jgi:hypothetical protein